MMACSTNPRIHVKGNTQFDKWLHVLSNHVAIDNDARNNFVTKEALKAFIILGLEDAYELALIGNVDIKVLSRNGMNIPP